MERQKSLDEAGLGQRDGRDKGKKGITKEFAGILFSSSFTVNGDLKESAYFSLKVPNWPL